MPQVRGHGFTVRGKELVFWVSSLRRLSCPSDPEMTGTDKTGPGVPSTSGPTRPLPHRGDSCRHTDSSVVRRDYKGRALERRGNRHE